MQLLRSSVVVGMKRVDNVRSCGVTVVRLVGQPDPIASSEPKFPGFRCWNLASFPSVMEKETLDWGSENYYFVGYYD